MNYQEALLILELNNPPTAAEIKQSFHKRALLYHPDRNPGNDEALGQFQDCSRAYQFLIKNPSLWLTTEITGDDPDKPVRQKQIIEDLEDIFDDIFGFSRDQRILGYHPPQEIVCDAIFLAHGGQKTQRLQLLERCSACGGRAVSKPGEAKICTYCFGQGRIFLRGVESVAKVCPRCDGRGRLIRHPCSACDGYGLSQRFIKKKLHICPGYIPEQVYSLDIGDHKSELDLIVRFKLPEAGVFRIENFKLLCDYPISEGQAEAREPIRFPGIWGWVAVPVKVPLREGQVLLLPGQGLPKGTRGLERQNLHMTVRIVSDARRLEEWRRCFLAQVSRDNPIYQADTSLWKKLLRALFDY